MAADSRAWGWYHRHVTLVDVAVVAPVLLALVLLTPPPDGGDSLVHHSVLTIAAAVVACLAVVGRNRWPVRALAVTVAATVGVTSSTTTHTTAVFAVVFTLYTVALRTDRRVAAMSWSATAGALILTVAVQPHDHAIATGILSFLAWTALATAVGDGVRNRRAYVASIEERAERAEQSLKEEARRQVAEERLRIARELHDVMAHNMAVITVQAGVAGHLLTSDPAATAESIDHIKRAGRTVLDELSGIMTVLRDPDDSASGSPSPGLGQLDDLIASFAAAGLTVTLTRRGRPQPLGSAVDLVAYRVLQESLTNAHKHGTGTAHATINYSGTSIALCVTNPTDAVAARSAGHGLIGMAERAAAVGGQLTAEPVRGGRFTVSAVLPVPEGAR